ncbi:hypothetical protein EON64_06580 [archaeon]|nr:MAG: hypothetical protein EON64_06580 [archaeon]
MCSTWRYTKIAPPPPTPTPPTPTPLLQAQPTPPIPWTTPSRSPRGTCRQAAAPRVCSCTRWWAS